MQEKIKTVHLVCVNASRQFKQAQKSLISGLQEMDELKGYREFGQKSLFDYALHELGLTSDVADTLIRLARKSRLVPAFKDKIESEAIPISQARMIAPILTPQNQSVWLGKAETLSKRELEREIKREFPEKAVRETARFVTDERMELKIGISLKLFEKLKRVQDLLSQQTQKPASLEESLEAMTELYLERKDPVRKAKRCIKPDRTVPVPVRTPSDTGTGASASASPNPNSGARVPIPAAIKHAVNLRDQRQCTHHDTIGRCPERRWLDFHHIKPVSHGGVNSVANLTLRCRGHHFLEHGSRAE